LDVIANILRVLHKFKVLIKSTFIVWSNVNLQTGIPYNLLYMQTHFVTLYFPSLRYEIADNRNYYVLK